MKFTTRILSMKFTTRFFRTLPMHAQHKILCEKTFKLKLSGNEVYYTNSFDEVYYTIFFARCPCMHSIRSYVKRLLN
jgi:hypothetical protein